MLISIVKAEEQRTKHFKQLKTLSQLSICNHSRTAMVKQTLLDRASGNTGLSGIRKHSLVAITNLKRAVSRAGTSRLPEDLYASSSKSDEDSATSVRFAALRIDPSLVDDNVGIVPNAKLKNAALAILATRRLQHLVIPEE